MMSTQVSKYYTKEQATYDMADYERMEREGASVSELASFPWGRLKPMYMSEGAPLGMYVRVDDQEAK